MKKYKTYKYSTNLGKEIYIAASSKESAEKALNSFLPANNFNVETAKGRFEKILFRAEKIISLTEMKPIFNAGSYTIDAEKYHIVTK